MLEVDYAKALDDFVDICNTGVSDYQKVWQNNSIRALVRKCTGLLTRLSSSGREFDALKSIARADLLWLADAIQTEKIYDEFIGEAERCGKTGPLPSVEEFSLLIERTRVKQSAIMAQMDSVRALVELSSYFDSEAGGHNELMKTIDELCYNFRAQRGLDPVHLQHYDPVVLEKLVKFRETLLSPCTDTSASVVQSSSVGEV